MICHYLGPGLASCSCATNYSLATDSKACTPNNNCEKNNGNCEQNCVYSGPGINVCTCNSTFVQSDHNSSACTAIATASLSGQLIGGVAGGAIFIIAVIVLIIVLTIRHRRWAKANTPFDFRDITTRATTNLVLRSGITYPTEYKRDLVEISSVLGSGNFGEVSKATLTRYHKRNQTTITKNTVAVKSLHLKNNEDQTSNLGRDAMLSEAALMAQFNHDNVVRLIGVVTIGEPLLIILEYCENGSMDVFLQKNIIDLHEQIRMSIECAEGMAYLASLGFIHRDLASRNVLLTFSLLCKIADFGMSRATIDREYYRSSNGMVAVRWAAPEALEHHKFSEQSDVWSFGVLLWEIWTRADIPYKNMGNDKVWANVVGGYRLEKPVDCSIDVYSIMQSCWVQEGLRPKFQLISNMLSTLDKKTGSRSSTVQYTIPDRPSSNQQCRFITISSHDNIRKYLFFP